MALAQSMSTYSIDYIGRRGVIPHLDPGFDSRTDYLLLRTKLVLLRSKWSANSSGCHTEVAERADAVPSLAAHPTETTLLYQ